MTYPPRRAKITRVRGLLALGAERPWKVSYIRSSPRRWTRVVGTSYHGDHAGAVASAVAWTDLGLPPFALHPPCDQEAHL